MDIVCTRIGLPTYRRLLGPLLDIPDPHIQADAAINMRRGLIEYPGKLWWLAVVDGRVLAQAAAWPIHGDAQQTWESGHNYEYGWRTRGERYWPLVHAARQAWIAGHLRRRVTTWLHDEDPATGRTSMVVERHLQDGWVELDAGWSPDRPAQFCRQLAWRP